MAAKSNSIKEEDNSFFTNFTIRFVLFPDAKSEVKDKWLLLKAQLATDSTERRFLLEKWIERPDERAKPILSPLKLERRGGVADLSSNKDPKRRLQFISKIDRDPLDPSYTQDDLLLRCDGFSFLESVILATSFKVILFHEGFSITRLQIEHAL